MSFKSSICFIYFLIYIVDPTEIGLVFNTGITLFLKKLLIFSLNGLKS
jgi:hypothetical protein